jgi:hypothetical protein
VIERGGAVLHHETLAATTDALALSADGAALAVGGFSAVRVLADGPGGFAPAATVAGGAAELPTRVALDADGETLAVGWWDFATGTSVRLEVWDLVAGVRRVHRDQPGLAAAPQNFPQAVLLTRDGRRAAFGLWGAADARPEALLVDVATDTDVLAVDLPGSVEAAALDASGTRLALAVKDAHANAFASTGSVLLVDSGERDVQVVVPPAPGGVLSLAASRPGQDLTLFLLGAPAAALPVPGLGTSWVDPTQRVFWLGALPDAAGQSSRVLPLPATTDLVDLPLAVQAIFVGPGWLELSGTAARPVVL